MKRFRLGGQHQRGECAIIAMKLHLWWNIYLINKLHILMTDIAEQSSKQSSWIFNPGKIFISCHFYLWIQLLIPEIGEYWEQIYLWIEHNFKCLKIHRIKNILVENKERSYNIHILFIFQFFSKIILIRFCKWSNHTTIRQFVLYNKILHLCSYLNF